MTALAVEDVSKNYGGVAALAGISLQLAEGERRVLLGPNGDGKTTLFHTISGSVMPSAYGSTWEKYCGSWLVKGRAG